MEVKSWGCFKWAAQHSLMKLFLQLDSTGTRTMGGYQGWADLIWSQILYAEIAAHRRIQLDSLTFWTILTWIVLLKYIILQPLHQGLIRKSCLWAKLEVGLWLACEFTCFDFNYADKTLFTHHFLMTEKAAYSMFSTSETPKALQTYTFSQPDNITCACISNLAYFVLIRCSTLFDSLLSTEHSLVHKICWQLTDVADV